MCTDPVACHLLWCTVTALPIERLAYSLTPQCYHVDTALETSHEHRATVTEATSNKASVHGTYP
jgi:hypothetical protein